MPVLQIKEVIMLKKPMCSGSFFLGRNLHASYREHSNTRSLIEMKNHVKEAVSWHPAAF